MVTETKDCQETYLVWRHRPLLEKKEKDVLDSVQRELDKAIYELPDPPGLELGDGLLILLSVQADDVLD